jgi:eukaryotic-like serine/threonine-protein kinase
MMTRSMAPETDDLEEDEIVGQTIGKYEIVRLLGKGGMGRVYEATHSGIGKRVVVKTLNPEIASNRDAVARFHREAQAASAAESPHIVEIFDTGFAEDGSPFIVMELLRGESLATLLRREGKLSSAETTRIVLQVLRGLSRAHAAGIVHRDLKPDNIFLVDRYPDPPFAKILDFGISKIDRPTKHTTLTREGTVLGTPAYMSPEQAQGMTDVDLRTDLWAIGAILYECVGGRPPFGGATYEQIIVRICTTDPPPLRELAPDVSESIEHAAQSCLRRERDERPKSAAELLVLLGEQVPLARSIHPPSSTSPPMLSTVDAPSELGRRLSKRSRPSRKVPALILATSALVAGAVVYQQRDGESPQGQATTPADPGLEPTPTSEARPTVSALSAEPIVTTASTTPSATASAPPSAAPSATSKLRSDPPPATRTATASAVVVSSASPPAATVQPSAPKGVAGDLQIQRK